MRLGVVLSFWLLPSAYEIVIGSRVVPSLSFFICTGVEMGRFWYVFCSIGVDILLFEVRGIVRE